MKQGENSGSFSLCNSYVKAAHPACMQPCESQWTCALNGRESHACILLLILPDLQM